MTTPLLTASPDIGIDPIRRLQVLRAAIPGLVVVLRSMPMPMHDVWSVASDLESTLPAIGTGFVSSLHIVERNGEHLVADVRGPFGMRDRFDITLRDGWCWMEGRRLSAAMAAVPVDGETCFAWAVRIKIPGNRLLARLSARALTRTLRDLEDRARATG